MSNQTDTEGFKLRVSSEELAVHLKARADHHRERAALLEGKVATFKEKVAKGQTSLQEILGDAAAEAVGIGGGTLAAYAGPHGMAMAAQQVEQALNQMKASLIRHMVTAEAFDFFREHILGGDYLLTMAEVSNLEMVDKDSVFFGPGIGRIRDYGPFGTF